MPAKLKIVRDTIDAKEESFCQRQLLKMRIFSLVVKNFFQEVTKLSKVLNEKSGLINYFSVGISPSQSNIFKSR